MSKKAKQILLIALAFAAVFLLSHSQAWAVRPLCQEVQIFGTIKFVWNPGCEIFKNVFFFEADRTGCDESCTPTSEGCDPCWREGIDATPLTMCTCEDGEGGTCTGNLATDISNGLVECFAIRDSGPSLGVPISLNPPRGCVGGRCFR